MGLLSIALCLGVMGKSEMDHCSEVSFCILDKAQRDLFLGKEGRGPGSCHIAVDHRVKGGIFHPISARNPAELWSHSLERCPNNPWNYPLVSGMADPEPKVLMGFKLSLLVIGH